MILLQTFATVMVDLGLATDPATNGEWPVYLAVEPAKPAACLTVYLGEGRVRTACEASTAALIEHREATVTVRVRHPDYETALNKSVDIEHALNRSAPWQVEGALEINDLILQFPTAGIGRDTKNMHLMLTTWRVLLTRYASLES